MESSVTLTLHSRKRYQCELPAGWMAIQAVRWGKIPDRGEVTLPPTFVHAICLMIPPLHSLTAPELRAAMSRSHTKTVPALPVTLT
jgi:hypothetical protein